MKLYLSSYRLGNNPERLVKLFGENKKVAIINNAIDHKSIDERREKLQIEFDDLKSLGLEPVEVDLRMYFGNKKELFATLQNFGGVWVRGGNTFILRRAFAYSGFDKFLLEKRHDRYFIYAGYSAGICILSPTLHGYEIVDDLHIIPEKYKLEVIWNGLGFVDYYIAPHYKSDHPETLLVDKEVEYLKQYNLPFKTLHDGDVIVEEIF